MSTLLGLSAAAAYAFIAKVTGNSFVRPAKAAIPTGGTIKLSMRALDIEARREAMRQIETIMGEDDPIVQPPWRSVFIAFDNRIKGFSMHPTSHLFANDWGIETWSKATINSTLGGRASRPIFSR